MEACQVQLLEVDSGYSSRCLDSNNQPHTHDPPGGSHWGFPDITTHTKHRGVSRAGLRGGISIPLSLKKRGDASVAPTMYSHWAESGREGNNRDFAQKSKYLWQRSEFNKASVAPTLYGQSAIFHAEM